MPAIAATKAARIDDVLGDLTAGKPMDRLIVGDVGFGKTEVALRARSAATAISSPAISRMRSFILDLRRCHASPPSRSDRAIDDVLGDLTAGKPMDRLIVGDVGFGKTEVAPLSGSATSPWRSARSAATAISSPAISRMRSFILDLRRCHGMRG
jgi:hypothetical protein